MITTLFVIVFAVIVTAAILLGVLDRLEREAHDRQLDRQLRDAMDRASRRARAEYTRRMNLN